MRQLAIFDMDGTILDTLQDLTNAMNYTMKRFSFPELPRMRVRRHVGNGIYTAIVRSAPQGTPKKVLDEMFQVFSEYYQMHCDDYTKPYDGMIETLDQLKAQGVKLAVVSNKLDQAVQKLSDQYFPGIFDYIAGEKPGIRRKPAPDMILAAMNEFGISKEKTIYFGDGDTDIESAKAAGIDCVSVTWGFRDRELLESYGGYWFIDHVEEMSDAVKEQLFQPKKE